ncbi:MAG: DUF2188 domain-containing protein [Methanomassiliicoccaceae archaeon]|nr:DUF2188 domain-containing protein [Methanomassiliicoccaceae archaeon]
MSFFDRFKVKKEEPAEKEEHIAEDVEEEIKLETIETKIEMEMDDAEWAASKDKPLEGTTEETKMAEEKKKAAGKPAAAKKPAAEKKADNKVWHITKRTDDGMWQVKAEGAAKATKLFKTKAEAEEYVKTLKANNEGSRVVKHKKTGEFQTK